MMFASWLRQSFRSPVPPARAAGRAEARPAPRLRGAKVEAMEQRMLLTLVVNSVLDGPLASLSGDGKLELREAIQLATHPNTSIDGVTSSSLTNTIQFDPSLAGKTLNLLAAGDGSAGPSVFSVGNGAKLTIDGATGLTKGVTIARPTSIMVPGAGGSLTSVNLPAFRLATVQSNGGLTLKGLTVRGFVAAGFTGGGGDVQATGGGSAGLGGVIFNVGDLTILDSTLTGNTAQGGAGGSFRYIYHTAANGHLDRSDSYSGSGGAGLGGAGGDSNWDNQDGGPGGGPNGGVGGTRLYPDGRSGDFGGGGGGAFGSVILGDFGNAGSGGFGGGGGGGSSGDSFFWDSGTNGGNGGFGGGGGGGVLVGQPHGGLTGRGGEFGGNANGTIGGGGAGIGGAVFNWGGTVTVTNSTLTGNAARGGAGGTSQANGDRGSAGKGGGGAIGSINGTLTISDSTISSNTSSDEARGVVVVGYGGGTAKAVINNTIIGQSGSALYDYDLLVVGLGGTATASGQKNLIDNLFEDAVVTGLSGTLTGDPTLGPLQDNGGPTPTMALLAGSPAIDAGSNAAIAAGLTSDQRGDARIRTGTVDIGAVESRAQQTITFATLANRTFGDADFAISATSSSLLPVGFTVTGDASVYQNAAGVWYVHIIGAGSATITANAAGSADYESAPAVARILTIAKAASLTTTVGAGPFTYNGTTQVGGSGTVTGAGGLNTSATVTYSANADGTGVADFTNAGTYYVTAHYAGDANHTASDGAAVAIIINKATAAVNVTGYTGVYDGAYHGATGTATGVGGASVGTLNLGNTFTNVPGGTAHWTFDGGRNYVSKQGDVAIQILAKHITGGFTAASKVYDGKTSATVTSRSLNGVVGADAVSLTGGTATFASKNVGTWTVTLNGATLGGAAAGNYVLDSVATTTATITPRPLTGTATTQSSLNVASNGLLSFDISVAQSGIVDGQSVAQLFDGVSFALTVGGRTYSVRAQATARGGVVTVAFRLSDELKAILAANTTATNGGNAQAVALNLTAMSRDGNYSLAATASTKLFNTSK